MNAQEISIKGNILFTLLLFVYFVYICTCSAVVAFVFTCLLVFLFSFLLVYFCFLVYYVNNYIVFIFITLVNNLIDVKANYYFQLPNNIVLDLSGLYTN